MNRAERVRLWLRLVRLAVKIAFRPARLRHTISLAEAIHRDLGHDHDPRLILPEHQGPQ